MYSFFGAVKTAFFSTPLIERFRGYLTNAPDPDTPMPAALNYFKKTTADYRQAVETIIATLKTPPPDKPYTMGAMAGQMGISPSTLRNKITGLRAFFSDELFIVADYFGLEKETKHIKAYLHLLDQFTAIVETLPISPRTLSELSGISHHEFYRKLNGLYAFKPDEVDRFSEALENLRTQLDATLKNPLALLTPVATNE